MDNFTIVIFGATGDLAHRKLFPSVFDLALHQHLPDEYRVIGCGRRSFSHQEFRDMVLRSLQDASGNAGFDDGVLNAFLRRLFYVRLDIAESEGYHRLYREIMDAAGESGVCTHLLYYLAVSPGLLPVIVGNLSVAGLGGKDLPCTGWRKIIVEKPFGSDLQSARRMNAAVGEVFNEDQIFRIDHYLGKETVQNILVFRFSNGIFEPLWNRHYIASVSITIAEDFGIRGRGAFYEEVGLLRDIIQNHALQLLASVAMEPPVDLQADSVRDEKSKVLRSIRRHTPADAGSAVVLGQYEGYRNEKDVDPHSTVETFAAIRFFVDNWRWQGVPFYVKAGKNLSETRTQIVITFKCPPQNFFGPADSCSYTANQVIMTIQPEETIALRFGTKRPGEAVVTDPVYMKFDYRNAFPGEGLTAYHRLLLDAIAGDRLNFIRQDSVEHAWEVVDAIRHSVDGTPPAPYPVHSDGPADASLIYG
ncbi:glucose-6-phosphate dehydrogenase [Pelodictyon luteolum]|uniref:Glucose-6-phosphate 1-dehydrogenase n=1 Tax=Chlorobium luteolum (strain DSM 273 / BCRC 81028 / 2530) TaxID=319225 RepID=Q3B636_CHLL3|nr:glucose-6-phosphate dehydrogenase [Pelodictyon luteolum]ABB23195.1 glucose-6-phosphate 1-dehydrogenase [Pelodictyon luteolum DSM 273]